MMPTAYYSWSIIATRQIAIRRVRPRLTDLAPNRLSAEGSVETLDHCPKLVVVWLAGGADWITLLASVNFATQAKRRRLRERGCYSDLAGPRRDVETFHLETWAELPGGNDLVRKNRLRELQIDNARPDTSHFVSAPSSVNLMRTRVGDPQGKASPSRSELPGLKPLRLFCDRHGLSHRSPIACTD